MEIKWKAIAIIFMILFTLETIYIAWAFWLYFDEVEKTNECYYNVCSEYPEAQLQDGVCFCYDYDLLGDYEVVKTEVM
jgi:hypothetical protein|tara:strand:- start:5408 stop:5641 length:234 start_codon:yes stop_codon:yes gene_type:complete